MEEPVEVLRDVVTNLNDLGIEYFLVGPIAPSQPQQKIEVRLTKNLNIILDLDLTRSKDFINRFVLDRYNCPPYDLLYEKVKNKSSFVIHHLKSQVRITFDIVKTSEFAQSEFSRKTPIEIEPEFSVNVSTVEDVILKKLEFYSIAPSPQYISDVKRLIFHNVIDKQYLTTWIDKQALTLAWERASKN